MTQNGEIRTGSDGKTHRSESPSPAPTATPIKPPISDSVAASSRNCCRMFTLDVFIDLWRELTVALFAGMFAIGSVALAVGGIGVMNIMLVAVTERTREIGLRKAVGARRVNILQQFLLEAATLSLIGGLIGVAVGAGLGLSLRWVFPSLPVRISPFWVISGLAVSGFVGLFFGVYPAWKAARLDPVQALRYE